MKHLTPLELGRLLDGELAGRDLERAEHHLGECAVCRDALAALESQDTTLRSALTHDPGDAYFERFAEQVDARIRATPSPAPLPERPGAFGWFGSPRGLAWAGAVAAIVVGAGVVLLTARESGLQNLRRPELMRGQSANEPENTLGDRPAAPPASSPQPDMAPQPQSADDASGRVAKGSGAAARNEAERSDGRARDESAAGKEAPQSALTEVDRENASAAAKQSPSAATRVRRTSNGEEVPQKKSEQRSGFATPPPSTEAKLVKPAPQPLAPAPTSATAPALQKEKGRGAETGGVSLEAQDREAGTVCGTVRDRNGRPVPGAMVAIADVGRTTVADRTGHFCLATPAGTRTLSVMALGYQETRRSVEVGAGRVESDVVLDPVSVLKTPTVSTFRGLLVDHAASDISTWPAAAREPARAAQEKTDRAAAQRSADQFDAAAGEWGRVLDKVRGYPAETEVRSRLAECRYRAWQLAPSNTRRVAATDALTAYLVRAPMGVPRDSAAKHLDHVKP